MRRLTLTLLLAIGLAAIAPPARALNPFYLTGKLGDSGTDLDLGAAFPAVLDGDDTSWGLGLGLKLGRHLAFQAEYHDLGSAPGLGPACPPGTEVCIASLVPLEGDSTALSVSVLPHLPLTRNLRLYGKLGLVSWDSDISAIDDAGRRFLAGRSDEELLWGAGLRLLLPGPFGFFAEYERIADAFDTAAIGATLGF